MVLFCLSLIWHCSGWQCLLKRKGLPFHQGNTVSSFLHVAAAEFIFEIMFCPAGRSWCPYQARDMLSQCGTAIQCSRFLLSIIPVLSFLSFGRGWEGKRSRDRWRVSDYSFVFPLVNAMGQSSMKYLLEEPSPKSGVLPATASGLSCSTLGQLFLRHIYKELKEIMSHCHPAGERVVSAYWGLNVVKYSFFSTPCPKMAVQLEQNEEDTA